MDEGTDGRYGVEARWLTAGPPSGRNYVRNVLAEFGAGPDAARFVAFVRRGGSCPGGGAPRAITVPNLPSIAYNCLAIPLRTPRDVVSVLYQNFTPPVSRAGVATVVHDLIFLTRPESFTAAERAYLAWIPRLLPRADIVVAVSGHVRDEVLDRWPRRDPASVVVAPNGVSEALLSAASAPSPGEDSALAEIGVARPYVLYLGRLNRRKNLPALIRAFAASGLREHRLVLAGPSTPGVEDLEEISRQAGLEGRFIMTGEVPQAVLPALYRGADVFAYVSIDEGFGVPPLEAMAFGVPIVCSDIRALRETAAGGGARFVPPGDEEAIAAALLEAVEDSALRAAAASAGPAAAAQYRWSHTAAAVRRALQLAAR